jgi:hypothetical protein
MDLILRVEETFRRKHPTNSAHVEHETVLLPVGVHQSFHSIESMLSIQVESTIPLTVTDVTKGMQELAHNDLDIMCFSSKICKMSFLPRGIDQGLMAAES